MAHQSDNRYDLFIAYSDADRAWVNGFLLPALHVPTERVITSQKFRPGASLPGEFVEAVQASRYTVLVLSPSYLENEWTTFGGQLASYASVADNSKRLIPLHRYPCNLPLDIAFRVSLDCTDQNQHNWEQEIARLRDLLDLPEPVEEPIPCPYPGMRPFSSDEADLFFGRANEVEDLQRRLRHHNYFFIIGPSGSGKSSLVFAGLVPKLHKQQRGEWLVKSLRPGTNPLQALAKALGSPVEKVKELQSIADYTELVEAALVNSQPAQRFLLIIDQLEELFAQTEKLKQLAFIDALKCLRRIEKCVLILTMRADFYSDLMNSTLWPLDTIDRLEIAPLRGNNLQKAIVEPAEAQGVSLERDLLIRLCDDAAEEPGVLPLLQETMVLLWEKRVRRFLTLKAYEEMGEGGRSGLAVAIANKAEATFAKLDEPKRVIARRIFLRLVQFGEGRADTRRQLPITELRSDHDDPTLFDQTLRHLTDNRLLTLSGEESDADKKVDIAHEALISGWPTLRKWVSEWREAEQTRRQLEVKAGDWVRLGSAGGGLLDDIELAEAEQWQSNPDALALGSSEGLVALIQASHQRRKEAKAQQRRGVRLRNAAIAVLSALLVLTIVLGSAAYVNFQNAVIQTKKASSRALAADAELSLSQNEFDQALLLSVKANTVYNTLEARNSLLTALEQSAQIETMLRGEPSTVIQLALDTDGYLVAASYGYYVYIWNLQTRQLSKLRLEDKEFVEGIGLSADGQTLVTASAAGVWVWAIQTRTGIPPTGTRRTQLEEKMVSVPADVIPDTPMVFSSDKQLVAYGRCSQFSSDGGSFVCVKTQVSVKKIHGLLLCSFIVLGDVNSLTLNQDGTILASRSNKGVQLWNATTGQSMGSLPADATNTTSISFNSSGTMLVYSKGTSIQFWDVAKRRPFGPPFTGHAEQITSIAFSFDGTMMASSSLDRTVHLWSMSPGEVLSGQSLKILTGDAEPKMSVAFSGDGKTLAFGGEDGTIILWKTGATSAISPTIGKEAYGLRSALLSPDGTTLITGDEQGNIFLQHAGTGELLATLDDTMVAYPLLKQKPGRDLNNLASIQSLALSDDGGILAAGRLDGTVTLWNVKTRTPLTHFCYPDQLHKIALSANGQILAAGGIGDTIVLWSVTKGLIHTFSHLTVSPSSTLPVALSPKGTLLVTGSCAKEENGNCKQGQILLWNVVTGQPFGHRLLGHSSDISDVAFSPDERTLAASSEDGIMLWDTVIGNPIMPMLTLSADTHNTKYYDHILFSPDGNRLASYSSPGNVPFSFVVWDVGQHEPLVEKAFQEEDTIQGSVAFNRDGQQLAVVFKRSDSGSIGTFKKWNISIQSWQMVACHIANRNLHRNEWNQFVQGDPYGKVCPDFPLDP